MRFTQYAVYLSAPNNAQYLLTILSCPYHEFCLGNCKKLGFSCFRGFRDLHGTVPGHVGGHSGTQVHIFYQHILQLFLVTIVQDLFKFGARCQRRSMRKAFYVWRLNPIEENLCSNPFEFLFLSMFLQKRLILCATYL